MGFDRSLIRNIGPGHIEIDGTDIGLVDVEGFKLTPVGSTVEGKSSRTGENTLERAWHGGMGLEFEMLVKQTELDKLEMLWPGTTRVSGSGLEALDIGVVPGTPIPEYELHFFSIIAAQTPISDFTIYGAVFTSVPPMQGWGGKEQMWLIKGKGVLGDDGIVGRFGDPAATQDATAGAVSAVSPLDGAVGQSVNVTPQVTYTKDLRRDSLNAGNVRLYKNVSGNLTPVVGTIGGVNAGVATTVTFDPTSALDATSQYILLLGSLDAQNDIRDVDGNRCDAFDSKFTTT